MSDSKDSDVSITLSLKEMDLTKKAKTFFSTVKTFLFNNAQILVPLLTCIFTWACLYWLIPEGGYRFNGQDVFLMVWLSAFLSFLVSAKEWTHQRKTRGCYKFYFVVNTIFIVVSLIFAIYLFVKACDTLMSYGDQKSSTFSKYLFGFVFVILMICALIHYGLKSVWIEKKKEEEKQKEEKVKNLVNKQLMSIKEGETKNEKKDETLIKFNGEEKSENEEKTDTENNRVINSEFLMHVLSFFVISVFFAASMLIRYNPDARALLFLCVISSTWNFSIALMTKGREEKLLKLYWPYFLTTLFPLICTGILILCLTINFFGALYQCLQYGSNFIFNRYSMEDVFYVAICLVISYPMFFLLVKYGVIVIGRNFWRLAKKEEKGILGVI